MSKKTLALILSLLAVTVILLVIALSPTAITRHPFLNVSRPTPTPNMAFSTLSFSPNPVTLDASGAGEVDVILDTQTNEVSGVQLEMQYDSKALTNVSITSGPFFPDSISLFPKPVDASTGRIHYLLGMSYAGGSKPIHGSGVVAHIFFHRNPAAPASSTSTTIRTLDETKLTQLRVKDSVLKTKENVTILLTKSATAPATTTLTPANK
jgi:hypothetical protein